MNNQPSAFAVFCNPESRRTEGFCAASGRQLREWPILIPWLAVLQNQPWQARLVPSPLFLRLESPGRNWTVEQQLLLRGAAELDEEAGRGWARISAAETRSLENDLGRVHPMRQWFLGWRATLGDLSRWASEIGSSSRWLCPPEDVLRMYDKAACQMSFGAAGIPTPPALGIPANFDELWELMNKTGRKRVFLKPCHGSAATAVVALESRGQRIQAFTTLEISGDRLYNRRRIKPWRGPVEVRQLVDEVCRHRCLAQVWIPKAGQQSRPFDVRVLVVGRRARQVMVRLGRGPMTNSQLLGGKGDVGLLRAKMINGAWERMLGWCEKASALCFPKSLYAAFDVLVEPNFQTIHILEVNAFGDLLPGLLHEGQTTYEAEIAEAMLQTCSKSRSADVPSAATATNPALQTIPLAGHTRESY